MGGGLGPAPFSPVAAAARNADDAYGEDFEKASEGRYSNEGFEKASQQSAHYSDDSFAGATLAHSCSSLHLAQIVGETQHGPQKIE